MIQALFNKLQPGDVISPVGVKGANQYVISEVLEPGVYNLGPCGGRACIAENWRVVKRHSKKMYMYRCVWLSQTLYSRGEYSNKSAWMQYTDIRQVEILSAGNKKWLAAIEFKNII
jgi:hypothetical protein